MNSFFLGLPFLSDECMVHECAELWIVKESLMKQRYAIACGVASCFTVFAVAANATYVNADNIKIDAAIGWMNGKSQEMYYDTDSGKKTDQLDWKIQNTPIVKMGISWDAMQWLTLNAQGWTTLASRGTTMDEYFWYNDSLPSWSEWDHHPNSKLNYANEFDINLRGWLLNQPEYRLGGVAGFQQTRFSWTATGGSYQYFDGDQFQYGDYDRGEPISGYKQKFSLPYIGIAGMYRYMNFEVNALFKFSPWVKARDNDDYYYYDSTYRNKANNARYYSASLDMGYYLTPHAKVFTAFSWSKHKEGKGGSLEIDRDGGETSYSGGDAAGIANTNYSIAAGLQYNF